MKYYLIKYKLTDGREDYVPFRSSEIEEAIGTIESLKQGADDWSEGLLESLTLETWEDDEMVKKIVYDMVGIGGR